MNCFFMQGIKLQPHLIERFYPAEKSAGDLLLPNLVCI